MREAIFAVGVACGLALPYVVAFVGIIASAIYWAAYDTVHLCRHGELKPDVSRANWLLIVPKMFARYLWRELRSGFQGARRVA